MIRGGENHIKEAAMNRQRKQSRDSRKIAARIVVPGQPWRPGSNQEIVESERYAAGYHNPRHRKQSRDSRKILAETWTLPRMSMTKQSRDSRKLILLVLLGILTREEEAIKR